MAAQENFLVSTQDGTLSLYDLASYSLLESFQSGPLTYTMIAGPGSDNRLVFSAGGAGYGLVADTTIGRDISRIKGVRAPASTLGAGGKYYLAADYNYVLDVVDTASLAVIRTVDYTSVIPHTGNPGAIVAANNNAYIFPRGNSNVANAAVVNLSSFQLSGIALPAGVFCRRCASRTPDGSMVVELEREFSDNKWHVVLISTATNTIVHDFVETSNLVPSYFVVTRSTDPDKLFGYAVVSSGQAVALDLRPASQTYGQFLAATQVTLPDFGVDELVVNSDGSKLILAGSSFNPPPAPNIDVIDTAKMLTDPSNALVAQLTVNGGINALTVCTGFFSTTQPNTAPTVTNVSGGITNDKDNDITITGTNFQPGALVRIGSLGRVPANVSNPTTLTVTISTGAPAGKAQDIIVTNPMANDPPDQQNQSGLLAGKFDILPNPTFQPTTEFATSNQALPYIYEPNQQTMVTVPDSNPGDIPAGIIFNVDGRQLYMVRSGFNGYYVLPIDLTTNMPANPIPLPSTAIVASGQVIAASRDPQTGGSVIYVAWTDTTDLHVSKIDSDHNSPTFNTIVHTFTASLNGGNFLAPPIMTVGPDGKFAYVYYGSNISYLGIFNLTTGAFTNVGYDKLRVQVFQSQIYVTPDGKSLLMAGFRGNRTTIRVFDISTATNPKSFAELVPIPIPNRGFPYVYNYQVINKKLYAIDLTGAVVVFNFDRTKGDFRERGYVSSESTENFSAFGFSIDGSYFYAADYFADLVFVADTSKLERGGDPAITSIRSPYTPYLLAVSPVPPPAKPATAKHFSGAYRSIEPPAVREREKTTKIDRVQ